MEAPSTISPIRIERREGPIRDSFVAAFLLTLVVTILWIMAYVGIPDLSQWVSWRVVVLSLFASFLLPVSRVAWKQYRLSLQHMEHILAQYDIQIDLDGDGEIGEPGTVINRRVVNRTERKATEFEEMRDGKLVLTDKLGRFMERSKRDKNAIKLETAKSAGLTRVMWEDCIDLLVEWGYVEPTTQGAETTWVVGYGPDDVLEEIRTAAAARLPLRPG